MDETIIFFLHCLNPLGILESSSDNAGFSNRWNDDGEAIFWVGFEDVIFRGGLHEMKVKWGRGRGARGGWEGGFTQRAIRGRRQPKRCRWGRECRSLGPVVMNGASRVSLGYGLGRSNSTGWWVGS